MRLERIKLVNFCQHVDLEYIFPKGIISIGGINGSGKSNVVKGIYAAITGDFRRNDGVMLDNINKLCSEKDESYVELDFTTDGARATVKRNLRPNKRSLVINGGTPITGEKDISTVIQSLTGVTPEIMSDYIFVDQWKMSGIFTVSKSDRLSDLQALYGLSKAEVCYDELNRHAARIVVQVPLETVESIENQIKIKSELLFVLRGSFKVAATDDSLAQARLSEVLIYKSTKKEIELSEAKLANLNLDLYQFNEHKSKVIEKLLKLCITSSSEDSFLEYKRYQNEWRLVEHFDTVRAANIKSRLSLSKKMDNLAATYPITPTNYIELSKENSDKLSELTVSVISRQQNLNTLTLESRCPVCESTGPALLTAIKVLTDYLLETSPILDALTTCHRESREFDNNIQNYHRERSILDNEDQIIKVRLESIRPGEPSVSSYDVDLFLSSYSEIKAEYDDLSLKLDEVTKSVAFSVASITALNNWILHKREEIDFTLDYDSLELELRKDISAISFNKENKIRYEEQEKSLIESLNLLYDRLNKAKSDASTAYLNKSAKHHLDYLKEIMHRANLPKRLIVNYLRNTVAKTNEYLEDFASCFRLMSDEDLSFSVKFTDGRVMPASRLSGGERGVMALAFRLAVIYGVASGVNLLVLDEPTVGLDDDNIECLDIAFKKLSVISRSSGLQVIIISHEKAIERMCDHSLILPGR